MLLERSVKLTAPPSGIEVTSAVKSQSGADATASQPFELNREDLKFDKTEFIWLACSWVNITVQLL